MPRPALYCLVLFMVFASCKSYKNIPYFQDIPQLGDSSVSSAVFHEPTIQPDDLLSINVKTIESAINNDFDMGTSTMSLPSIAASGSSFSTSPTSTVPLGYLVDKSGNIELPYAGRVHVSGMSRIEARDTIQQLMKTYFKSPVVDLRFANFKITVIGEVLHPGAYTLPNEKISVLDAIGMAGDLTVFGKRENIIVIRDSGERKTFARLNINSSSIMQSRYFYLKQNDVVYIEPNKAKIASLDASKARTYALIASGLTVIIIIASRINF